MLRGVIPYAWYSGSTNSVRRLGWSGLSKRMSGWLKSNINGFTPLASKNNHKEDICILVLKDIANRIWMSEQDSFRATSGSTAEWHDRHVILDVEGHGVKVTLFRSIILTQAWKMNYVLCPLLPHSRKSPADNKSNTGKCFRLLKLKRPNKALYM